MRRLIFILLILTLLPLGFTQAAQERILSFDALINIHEDSTVTITETIRVISTGDRIQRGIFREFPTTYKDAYGNRVRVDFEILSVERDGKPEPYKTEGMLNGVKIYFGDEDVFLTPGEYTYAFTYQVKRVLGFFAEHDELYWNATGNAWDFPIDQASATIVLPAGVSRDNIKTAGFTGYQGDAGPDFTASVSEAKASFSTTRSLAPGEGLTVVVGWPKGIVAEPTSSQKLAWFFRDNLGLLLALLSLFLVPLWYIYAWYKVGRDPQKGIIIPRYTPPEGFSPAALRYIRRMGYDNKVLTSAIISLAVQGRLSIREEDKKYVLVNTGAPGQGSPEEDSIHSLLFAQGDEITLVNTNHTIVSRAIQSCNKLLSTAYKGRYFKANGLWLLPGLLLSALLVGLGFIFTLAGSYISVWSGLALAMVLLTLIGINVLFGFLLKAPTYEGRRLMDEIDGFKLFLEVAEKDYLQWSAPPERTPELFEQYLPHALALGVDQQWAEKFAGILAASAVDGEYRPAWYHGRAMTSFSAGAFAGSLSNSLNSAITSSGVAPGSSSGFSGGSSGGGGGGGGGGGW